MHAKYQRGELSLFWTAAVVGVVALVAMVALMSARYERNYFAEAWKRFTGTDAGKVIQQTQQAAATAVRPEAATIRKCTINGKPVYSNVECDAANPTTRKVELHDSKGFEAPKAPPVAEQKETPQSLQEKAIEKAIR